MIDTVIKVGREFGVSTAILLGVAAMFWYILRRLFQKDEGILTKVAERHVDFVDSLERTHKELTESNRKLTDVAEENRVRFSRLAESRDSLHRAAVHSIDILEAVAEKLGIEERTRPSIDSIRREILPGTSSGSWEVPK